MTRRKTFKADPWLRDSAKVGDPVTSRAIGGKGEFRGLIDEIPTGRNSVTVRDADGKRWFRLWSDLRAGHD